MAGELSPVGIFLEKTGKKKVFSFCGGGWGVLAKCQISKDIFKI